MKTKDVVTKISKWGNGYGIRVPIDTLTLYQLTEGSEVVLLKEDGGVKISPRSVSFADVPLSEILKDVTPSMVRKENIESTFGKPQGNEVW